MSETYNNNSSHKDLIRNKWIEFLREILAIREDRDQEVGIITLPSHEMQDVQLFVKEGFLQWEKTETDAWKITKGKLVCFEKLGSVFCLLRPKLVNAEVISHEIGSYFQQRYHQITSPDSKFPHIDAINLDFDGNLSKNNTSIDRLLKTIFEFQSRRKCNFSLFLTLPETETEDTDAYKSQLRNHIQSNIDSEHTASFRTLFQTKHNSIEDLEYYEFVIIGLAKMITKESSQTNYEIIKREFYLYGESDRRVMFSLLLNFKYIGDTPAHGLYFSEVVKTLDDIKKLT